MVSAVRVPSSGSFDRYQLSFSPCGPKVKEARGDGWVCLTFRERDDRFASCVGVSVAVVECDA